MTEETGNPAEQTGTDLVELATELTIAWLGNPNNRATAEDVPAFLRSMHATVSELSGQSADAAASKSSDAEATEHVPAVSVRRSLASKDHIISMIDGKPYKTLRRHLSTHGLTPEDYRQRYGLKADYPMVSENYSAARREMAHKIGLGQKGRTAKAAAKPAPAPAPSKARKPRATRSKTV